MTQKKHAYPWIVALVGVALLWLFFGLCYPYHLRHREQTILFLANADWIRDTYYAPHSTGATVRMLGDGLQQYFYYIGAGPTILALLLGLLGVVWYQIGRSCCSRLPRVWANVLPWLLSVGVVLWEGGRECLPEYPVASTLQLLGWSALLLGVIRCAHGWLAKAACAVLALVSGVWLLGYEPLPQTKLWGKPDMLLEQQMALDVEASLGNWQQVERLSEQPSLYRFNAYYRNLSRARRGELLDQWSDLARTGSESLFLPVNETGNYFQFSAVGEAWWAVGDLTMAEHATLLGMIFSPRHTGSRQLRRLAEIAIKRGDAEGADKYLRLLAQSSVHRQWALSKRELLSSDMTSAQTTIMSDTLRLASELPLCLRTVLDADPTNAIARQYLLCLDLMYHDLQALADDIDHYGCPLGARALEEAMLVVMETHPERREPWQPLIRREAYDDFLQFNQFFVQCQGNPALMKPKYGNSYWYDLRFAKP